MSPADAPPPYADHAHAAPRAGCAGETITRIDVHRYAPSSGNAADRAIAATSEAVGLDQPPTSPSVILAYVRLEVGEPCREADRRDSERLLRAQRFIASAVITALPDGANRVRIRVDVVDELPWVAGARFGGGGVRAASLGTLNLMGRGVTLVGSGERGGAYRPGLGVLLAKHGLFDRPAVVTLVAERHPLGGRVAAGVDAPFLVDAQRYGMRAGVSQETEYTELVRPAGPDAAARTERTTYDFAWVRRMGPERRRRVGLAGLLVMGVDVRTDETVVVVSDSGLVAQPDAALAGRFPAFGVGRLGAIGGLRSLNFITVRRFDALSAAQDVATGFQVSGVVAPTVGSSDDGRRALLATELYAGAGDRTSFAAVHLRAETERALDGDAWRGVVGSARLSWHRVPSERRTRVITVTGAALQRLAFPAQLTFRDAEGGLLAFPESRGAGGRRLVARVEERVLTSLFRPHADFAIGGFVDAGRLWAGDVPYGVTTPLRGSVGVSLMGAYPAGGKRLYRVDFAFPLNPEPGGSRFALRVTVADLTARVWREARDVSRARIGTAPTDLSRW
jgi:hypothetical protein